MKQWCRIAAIGGLCWLAACGTAPVPVCRGTAEEAAPHTAAPFAVQQVCTAGAQRGVLWVHVHADETTALQALRAHIRAQGQGCYLTLPHPHGRALRWALAGRIFTVDPNRMLTDHGRRQLLARQACADPQAADALAHAVEPLLSRLQEQRLLVAVHNNTAGGFGVGTYARGGALAADAAAVAQPQPQQGDDFFYVTHRRAFDFFRSRGHNVVLQHPQVRDDGSLSVWAAQAGIEYINVEAQHGHLQQQQTMLQAVQAYIDAFVGE